jgi:hypothetical protein
MLSFWLVERIPALSTWSAELEFIAFQRITAVSTRELRKSAEFLEQISRLAQSRSTNH